jgi:hypothetical protein
VVVVVHGELEHDQQLQQAAVVKAAVLEVVVLQVQQTQAVVEVVWVVKHLVAQVVLVVQELLY